MSFSSSSSVEPLVRVYHPKAILLAFHGTIAPVNWEDQCIQPYLRDHLLHYLENSSTYEDSELIEQMRDESFDLHNIQEIHEAPLVLPRGSNPKKVLKSVHNYVMWQLSRQNSSKAAISLVAKMWKQGYIEQQIKTPIFEGVLPAITGFKEKGIKVCMYSHVEQATCKLWLSSTTVGNLAQQIDHIFDETNAGPSRNGASYDNIASTLAIQKSDILMVSDYGQDVKIANDAGVQVVLVDRPEGRKNRIYYRVRFPHVVELTEITFA